MNPLAVVEPALHEIHHVRHAFRRILGIGLERKGSLRRLDDDHWRSGLTLRAYRWTEPRRHEGNEDHEDAEFKTVLRVSSCLRGSGHRFASRLTPMRAQSLRITHAPQRGKTGLQTFCPHVTR